MTAEMGLVVAEGMASLLVKIHLPMQEVLV